MHNIKEIRQNLEHYKDKLKSRNIDVNYDDLVSLDEGISNPAALSFSIIFSVSASLPALLPPFSLPDALVAPASDSYLGIKCSDPEGLFLFQPFIR